MENAHWNHSKLLRVSGGYWQSCTLHAAVKLDLFTTIDDIPMDKVSLADKLHADHRAMRMLLDALVAMELLRKVDGLYANTSFSKTYLSSSSKDYLGHIIMHHHNLMPSWSRLSEGVQTGKPQRMRSSFRGQEILKSFQLGMFNQAMLVAPKVAQAVDLLGKKHLLDLGGGPGTYAVHFCLTNPGLKATVFDLSSSRPFATEIIKRFDLSDRISFEAGNYMKDQIKGHYDAIWMSHILHAEGPRGCKKIIQRAYDLLDPGGIMLVHDFLLNDTLDGPLFPALFSLNMLLGTQDGQAYSETQIKEMLIHAGLQNIRRIPTETPNGSGVLAGEKT